MEDDRWLMMAVLDHLQKSVNAQGLKSDSINDAISALSNAYSLDIENSATKERYPLDGLSLTQIFKAGREQLLSANANSASRSAPAAAASTDTVEQGATSAAGASSSAGTSGAASSEDDGFLKFVTRLKATTNLFKGVEEGSAEYDRRMTRAREKYDAKRSEKKTRATSGKAAPSRPATEQEKARAERLKTEGNTLLKAKKYEEALEQYTRCIELDDKNAVYFSNRAAAKIMLSRFSEAVDDCKRSIALDGKFMRPREKLATAYRSLGMFDKEVEALTGVLRLAPHNEAIKEQLRQAKDKIRAANGDPEQSSNLPGGVESLMNGMPRPNAGTLDQMARSMGINLPAGAADTFLNSGALDQIDGLFRDNPGMLQQAMQTMMNGGFAGMGGNGAANGATGNSSGRS